MFTIQIVIVWEEETKKVPVGWHSFILSFTWANRTKLLARSEHIFTSQETPWRPGEPGHQCLRAEIYLWFRTKVQIYRNLTVVIQQKCTEHTTFSNNCNYSTDVGISNSFHLLAGILSLHAFRRLKCRRVLSHFFSHDTLQGVIGFSLDCSVFVWQSCSYWVMTVCNVSFYSRWKETKQFNLLHG